MSILGVAFLKIGIGYMALVYVKTKRAKSVEVKINVKVKQTDNPIEPSKNTNVKPH